MFNSNVFNGQIFNIGLQRPAGGYEAKRPRSRERKPLEPVDYGTLLERFRSLPPEAVEIVEAVALRQVDAPTTDSHQQLEELERELELAGIQWQSLYLELLKIQRQKLLDAERQNDDDLVMFLLLSD